MSSALKEADGKLLYIQCSSGISGDMFLAALADLAGNLPESALSLADLERLFAGAGLELSLKLTPAARAGGPGKRLEVLWPAEQPLRHPADLYAIIERLAAPAAVRARAKALVARLAEAEAVVHGVDVSQVHFHEVGAIDTLVDIFGACWALDQLGVGRVLCASLPWFGGFVDCSHGRMALPAPATLQLLQGKPFFMTDAEEELITPTGAVLLDRLVDGFVGQGVFPAGQPADDPDPEGSREPSAGLARCLARCLGRCLGSGLGYGSREPSAGSDWPSRGLRLHLFSGRPEPADLAGTSARPSAAGPAAVAQPDTRPDRQPSGQPQAERVWELTCNLDHLSGEQIGQALVEIMADGALDVLWLPGTGKKNRPSGELRVLCAAEAGEGRAGLEQVQTSVFKHTHTLGLRLKLVERLVLPRRAVTQNTPWGPLKAKEYELQGRSYRRIEHEELDAAAKKSGGGLPGLVWGVTD